jgi:MerR family copper efflux transcriptional regulator
MKRNAYPKAIRLYEELGLLGIIKRHGKYRVYGERDLERVQLIRQAQQLGFRLAELKPILTGVQGDYGILCRFTRPRRHDLLRPKD